MQVQQVKIVAQEPDINEGNTAVEIQPDFVIKIENDGNTYTFQAIAGGGVLCKKLESTPMFTPAGDGFMVI